VPVSPGKAPRVPPQKVNPVAPTVPLRSFQLAAAWRPASESPWLAHRGGRAVTARSLYAPPRSSSAKSAGKLLTIWRARRRRRVRRCSSVLSIIAVPPCFGRVDRPGSLFQWGVKKSLELLLRGNSEPRGWEGARCRLRFASERRFMPSSSRSHRCRWAFQTHSANRRLISGSERSPLTKNPRRSQSASPGQLPSHL
jgi:hypothetical protein